MSALEKGSSLTTPLALCALILVPLAPEVGLAAESAMRFKHLTTEQGLSDSTVEAIAQDRQGFLWFGTADGLNRYDGYSFKVYRHREDDPTSLSADYVWDLLVDSDGVLWVGGRGGLSRYDAQTDSFVRYRYETDAGSVTNDARDLFQDREGTLWVGTSAGLSRFNETTGSFTRYQHSADDPTSLSHDDVQAVFEDTRGHLWVGTRDGLNTLERETGRFSRYRHDPDDPNSLSSSSVRSIHQDRLGYLWIGTENGPNRLDLDRPGHFMRYDSPEKGSEQGGPFLVWTLFEDRVGDLWAGTDRGGLAYLDRARDRFVHTTRDSADPRSLSSNVVLSIFEDASGDLWAGHYAGGVSYLDRHGAVFQHFRNVADDSNSLSHDSVLSVWESADETVWLGTEDGLVSFDRTSGRFERFLQDPNDSSSLSAPAVMSIHEDQAGAMWVGTFAGGLNRFDRRTKTFARVFPPAETEPSSDTFHINAIQASGDDLWMATFDGLYRLDRGTEGLTRYEEDPSDPSSLAHDLVWTMREVSGGHLWFGTLNGLSLYDPERDAFTNYRHDPEDPESLSFDSVQALYEDREGFLWVGTHGGGLNRFDPEQGSFRAYRVRDGLPSDVVYGILEDSQGKLWVSTNQGLARFDKNAETFIAYDENDGLQGRQFNRDAALEGRNGALFFGGIHGLNVFDPSEIEVNETVPPVVLTDFELFNRPVAVGRSGPLDRPVNVAETITLSHEESVFSFSFAALNYRSPAKNRYAYKLEGFDEDWVPSGEERSATYTSLDPGTYTFRVRGSNNSGRWNEEGASIELVLLPPYWATWWFRLLALASIATLVVLIYQARVRSITERNRALREEVAERLRVEELHDELLRETEAKNAKLEAQNAELERFSYTVSHDLKSPLVTIRGFLGIMRRDAEKGDIEQINRSIERIGTAAEVMSEHLEGLLELSRTGRLMNPPEEVELTVLAQEAIEVVRGSIEDAGVEVEIVSELPVVFGDRMRLLEVFQNLLENAVKFMGSEPAPRIEIGSRREGSETVCYVRDNGLGIESRHHEKVFGLFERLETKTAGSGVGLALVRRIVEMHSGRVWVESDGLGHGAAFCFVLGKPG